MYYSNKLIIDMYKRIFNIAILLIFSIYIFFNTEENGYTLLFVLPFMYLVFYELILRNIIKKDNTRLFFQVLRAITYIRYALLPLLIVIFNYYGGRSPLPPQATSINTAILLMSYELIVISIFIFIYERYSSENKGKLKIINEKKSINLVYYFFCLAGILLFFAIPEVRSSINFVTPNIQQNIIKNEISFVGNLGVYIFLISKQLIFLLISKKLYNLYTLKKSEIYLFLNSVFALLNTLIYFGTNRSDIIITAVVSFLVLYKLYGNKIIKYLILGFIAMLVTIFIVTSARDHASISKNQNAGIDFTDTLQVYTGGPYNVAIAIETKEMFPEANDPSVLFFDIFRPMIGVNILIKDLPFKYSNLFFNERIWLNEDRVSQIIPMIGQGNLYFSFALAPLFSILFITLFYLIEKRINREINIELYYFLSLVIVRLGFFMGQNTMNMINDMSMNLVLFLLVYKLNYLKVKQSNAILRSEKI